MKWFQEKFQHIHAMTLGEMVRLFGKQIFVAFTVFFAMMALLLFLVIKQVPVESDQSNLLAANSSSQVLVSAIAISSGAADVTAPAESGSEAEETRDWYVDIKGAVAAPQIYPVDDQMRIHDVIALAGGLTADADGSKLNYSQRVYDEMVIYVPKIDEQIPAEMQAFASQAPVTTGTPPASSEAEVININTADATQLQEISGVGEKKASDIIAYREANGPFQNVDELTNVSGIGEKTLEKMRQQITVQ